VPISTIRSLDPHYSTDWTEYFVNFAVYNNLVEITAPDGLIGPDLAESWEFSSDGKAITFNLVQNAIFHDGTKFDAKVAKWNIERVKDKEVGANQAAQIAPINSIQVIDDYTLKVSLDRPWRPILASLAERPGYQPSPNAIKKHGSYSERQGEFGRNPVGTGPYVFREWVLENHITLDRFDQYFEDGPPYLDSIEYQHFNETEVGLAMLRTGEADIYEVEGTRLKYLPIIGNNPKLKTIGGPTGRTYFIQFTVDEEPYDNKSLRQAISYALDRQSIIDALFYGEAVPAYQWEGKGWAHNPDARFYDYDPQKAKEKLAEAGYPNGVKIKYWCTTTTAAIELCSAIQAQLSEVGIDLDIQPILGSDLWKKIYSKRDHGVLAFNTWWSPRGDPHNRLQILVDSAGFHTRTFHYESAEADTLMQQGAGIYDPTKAQEIYWNIQKVVAEDAPVTWMLHPNNYMAASKGVMGFDWAPDVIPRIRDIWMAK
jgi:peptide/nickel transport system substrate-binding protein